MTINSTSHQENGRSATPSRGTAASHVVKEPEESFPPKSMPIAIIGMSCRFPGNATDPSKLWDLCIHGRNAWSPIPEDRFRSDAWYHPDKEHRGTSYAKGGYFLDQDLSKFDASFFNFSSEVAGTMDPEVRMLLECVYEALESAGLTLEDAAGSNTAVCAGTCFRDFHDSHLRDPSSLERFYLTGNGMAMISNRVSHFFDLKGPSIAVDTGCSTTLTLLHLACQSLRTGEAEMAIVGGSNALINPDMFISGTILGLLSAEGKCFAFDSRASGYGRGEGAATLVLKPLDAAVRDGDPIRAVIRETAINQDGKTPTLTSPSREAQEDLIRRCYAKAGLDPVNTGYVEAHGTGTQAGDTSEAFAVGRVIGKLGQRKEPLVIGSVKTNIGHTEATSGLAGVIKAVLAIEAGCIPPLLNFENPNPKIPFEDLGLQIPLSVTEWPKSARKRASVNNFGYGGSNAHAIVEHPDYLVPHYQSKIQQTSDVKHNGNTRGRVRVLKLGARDEISLNTLVSDVQNYVRSRQPKLVHEQEEDILLDRLVYTTAQRRSRFPWNTTLRIAKPVDILEKEFSKPQRASRAPRLGFVFSGQGAQWYSMGRELLSAYPVFYEALREATECLQELGASWSLLDELAKDEKTSRINEVIISLPSSVAIQLALVRLLQSWGIEPAGVTGHSSGEVAAAFAAGAIDMRSALAIVYTRGTLTAAFQNVLDQRGGMIAVGLSREEVTPYLERLTNGRLVVACVNSPVSVTISGDMNAIGELETVLAGTQIFARRLRVDAAYHSHHMLGFADDYHEALSQVLEVSPNFKKEITYSSPVSGGNITSAAEIASPAHWVKNMVQPVEFLDCLTNLCLPLTSTSTSIDILIEVGPHSALQGPIRQILSQPALKDQSVSYLSCLRRGVDAVATMQTLVCDLVERGYPVSLGAVNFPGGCQSVQILTDLTPYPWNHQVSHWIESRVNRSLRNQRLPAHDLLGTRDIDQHPFDRRWRHIIRPSEVPWVRHHLIQSNIVYPGAGYIAMALEASRQIYETNGIISHIEIRQLDLKKALVIPDTSLGVEVQLCLQGPGNGALDPGWQHFVIMSVDQTDTWSLHCEGDIKTTLEEVLPVVSPWKISRHPKDQYLRKVEPEHLYSSLRHMGLNHGPIFQNITSIRSSGGRSSCDFNIVDAAASMPFGFQSDHLLHPTTLDSVFQAVYTALSPNGKGQSHDNAMLPKSIRHMRVSGAMVTSPGTTLTVESTLRRSSAQGFESDAVVISNESSDNGSSHPLLEVRRLFCQALSSIDTSVGSLNPEKEKVCFNQEWMPDFSLMGPREWHRLLPTPGLAGNPAIEGALLSILKPLLHKIPKAKILELSGRSGDVTEIMLNGIRSLGNSSQPLVTYTWADLSFEHMESARQRFSESTGLISFQQVGTESGALTEELGVGSYDLILCRSSDVECYSVHEIGRLVKDSGLLLILDMEEDRQQSFVDLTNLKEQFEILELDISSMDKIVLATRIHVPDSSLHYRDEVLLVHSGPAPGHNWLRYLEQTVTNITRKQVVINCRSLGEIDGYKDRTVIFLDDPIQSVLLEPTTADVFDALKSILIQSSGILWVTRGGAMDCERPAAALSTGLLRTLRCEYPSKKYISIDLENTSNPEWSHSEASSIARAFHASFQHSSLGASLELDYAVRDQIMHIPRVMHNQEENSRVFSASTVPESIPFFNKDRNIRLGVRTPGLLDSLAFVEDDTVTGPLPDDYIQIQPAAFGLNFRDVMVAMGQLDETRMGFECSGHIVAIGSEARARGFEIGDPVYAFLRGYFANTIRVHHTSVAKVPEGMDMKTAASIPLVFITAYHALYNMARIRKGERILIHSGTGGVGQAAIMLAQLAKADVFVTVGSKEKREFLRSTYDIPEDRMFNSRNASFAPEIMAATDNKGVDIMLNSLAGPLLSATWNCIAPFGRFIEIGKRDLELNNSLEMGPFVRSVSFSSLDLIMLGELRGDIVADIFVQVNALLRVGVIRPVSPIAQFSMADAEKAYRTMQAGKHMGKIVIVPSENEMVTALHPSNAVSLSSAHTYLIVGGLGGIGRSIAERMIMRGARNLVLLSRSAGRANADTLAWVQSCGQSGIHVELAACDVANKEDLGSTLARLGTQLPPIKGVIQAAMVLRDTLFETMTLEAYDTAIRPKVHGSWNLHELLPSDLDFFVMLSSVSGVGGNATQANYAAGGTYQDALARHRVAMGQKAVSVDLGMVKGVGVLASADGKKTATRLERLGLRPLDEEEVLGLVDAALGSINRTPVTSQVITGIQPSWTRNGSGDAFSDATAEIQLTDPFWMRDPRFLPLETLGGGEQQGAGTQHPDAKDGMLHALQHGTKEEATAALSVSLTSKLALMFVVPETDIDVTSPLARLGVDSLIAVELRNWISAVVQADCSVFEIMQATSIAGLADLLVAKSALTPKSG